MTTVLHALGRAYSIGLLSTGLLLLPFALSWLILLAFGTFMHH